MVPVHVAVVPYYTRVKSPELEKVVAALQIQVTRDFTPIWGVTATVSAFPSLQDVPPGYMALVIVSGLPGGHHGVHYSSGSHPVAIVEAGNDPAWQQLASHELLEMIVDPWGNRVMPGRSLEEQQGQVEYLLEICDPCQQEWYLIDGVMVSDFVTPNFYATSYARDLRYSFLGTVKKPRTPLAGGYVTWRLPGSEEIWQKWGADDAQPLPTVGLLAALALRPWVDWRGDAPPHSPPTPKTLDEANAGYRDATAAAKRYGDALERDIQYLLTRPARGALSHRDGSDANQPAPEPPANVPREIRLLYDLAYDTRVYETFKDDARALLADRGFPQATIDAFPPGQLARLAEPCVFQWAYEQIVDGGIVGDGLGFFGVATWWLAALGGG